MSLSMIIFFVFMLALVIACGIEAVVTILTEKKQNYKRKGK